jgi:DNA-3-methyladenine glycosylase
MPRPTPAKLTRSFYRRPAVELARALLGKRFTRIVEGERLSGMIVETEAYLGDGDDAAHSARGKTERNATMFGEAGKLYVYFTYGAHHCLNVVAPGAGDAALIRAVEPLEGIDTMARNRFGEPATSEKERRRLADGPGKLCQAYGVDLRHDGVDLAGDEIFLEREVRRGFEIVTTTRVGISKSSELPLRFYIKDNQYVSKR